MALAYFHPLKTYYKLHKNIHNKKRPSHYRTQKKPQWVVEKVIRMKAINPTLSHYLISQLFNATHDTQSVSSTFVGYTLRDYAYELKVLTKALKNRPVKSVLFNATWGMDLTFVNGEPLLGVVEHHSRKLLTLIPLKQKSSVEILLALLSLLQKYPKPKQIRTDNEKCFTSKLVKFALSFMGIKHQTIDKNSPWQNGRVERLFGTLKSTLAFTYYDKEDLPYLTYSFQFWYNNMRLHQNLNYQIPQLVYEKRIDALYEKEVHKE
jgi:transposase InsO family protein